MDGRDLAGQILNSISWVFRLLLVVCRYGLTTEIVETSHQTGVHTREAARPRSGGRRLTGHDDRIGV